LNGKQADFCFSEWRGERSQDADLRQNEGPMNSQDAPSALGLNAEGNEREFGDNGMSIAGARDGKEWTLRRPGRDGQIGDEPGNGEALGQQTEFKVTSRGGH